MYVENNFEINSVDLACIEPLSADGPTRRTEPSSVLDNHRARNHLAALDPATLGVIRTERALGNPVTNCQAAPFRGPCSVLRNRGEVSRIQTAPVRSSPIRTPVCNGAVGDRRTAYRHTNITRKSGKGVQSRVNGCKPKWAKPAAIATKLAPLQRIRKIPNWIS